MIKLARPNLYRIDWQQSSVSAAYNSTATTQAVWSAGSGDFLLAWGGGQTKYKDMETALAGATGISGGAASTIPGTFFKMNWGNQLGGPVAGEKRQADEKVGDVDCFVFSSELKGRTKKIWIGKQDFLIHQVQNVTSSEAMKAVMAEAAKRNPLFAARTDEDRIHREYLDRDARTHHREPEFFAGRFCPLNASSGRVPAAPRAGRQSAPTFLLSCPALIFSARVFF